jgi:hypothetical protein
MSGIPKPPPAFDGTIGEIYDSWAEKVLLSADAVEGFHHLLIGYLESADPLFLVRMVTGTERGVTLRSRDGQRLRPTDNAPSWWIHRELFAGRLPARAAFDAFVEAIPCHMFAIPKGENISLAGWHVAHIFDVKNGDTLFAAWDRQELVRRMIRNIHPCNYFYIPKQEWQRHGGDPSVISFFYDKFASKYEAIWPAFMKLAEATPRPSLADASEYRIAYPTPAATPTTTATFAKSVEGCTASYSFSRLCFKANVIEPLAMSDRFCVITPAGTFGFTKQEFYDEFPGVVASASYRERGLYHFPKAPARAMRFRI